MTRRFLLLAAPLFLASVGCQSIGNLPGIDPTDYAYMFYQSNVSQVYSQSVPQVQSSALEAMADLGYTEIRCKLDSGIVTIQATTLDHRPARVTIQPRNTMSSMTVKIGECGDEMVSETLTRRVALNFGELPRTLIPIEPTLSRRIDLRSQRRLFVPPVDFVPSPPTEAKPPVVPAGPGPFALSNAGWDGGLNLG